MFNKKVTGDQNDVLISRFEVHEIKEVIFSMHPDKVPRPDGMNPKFYQSYWDVVGELVTTTCLEVLNNGRFLEDWNATHIILI